MRVVRSVGAALVVACSPAGTETRRETVLDVPRLDGGARDAPGIRFTRVPPSVGSRFRVSTFAGSTEFEAHGSQHSEYESSYTVEVLATNGPAPSRVRLVFEKNLHRFQGVDKPTVIDGHTYVVETEAPFVRDSSGGPVAKDEAERVLDVVPDLGTRTQVDQVLPDGTMQIGEARHELASALLTIIHPRAWTLDSGTCVLAEIAGDEALFGVSLEATSASGLRMAVKGQARVRLRDARLTGMTLGGNYEQNGKPVGSFSLTRKVEDL